MVVSKFNDQVSPVGDDQRRNELQRIYDKISALVCIVIHLVVDAFLPIFYTCAPARHSGRDKNKQINKEKLQKNPKGNLGKGSRAKPAKETKASEKSEKVEQQVVVAHPATPTKASKKSEKVEQQQVVACEKEQKNVGQQQVGCPAEVHAEVKMSYERYLQIGYKELERLTLENYSLSGLAALISLANLFTWPTCFGTRMLGSCFCETCPRSEE